MKKRTDGKAGRVERGAETPASPKVRFRLLTKIVVFLLLVLVPLAAVSSYFAYQSLRTNLTEEFTNKGTAIAALGIVAAVVFAGRLTRPVTALVTVAQRVGQGDLSQLVPVTSRDEIGQMAATFNDSIVRLRALVQTEAERDEFEKLSKYMEQ